jgi:VWFA-related protein
MTWVRAGRKLLFGLLVPALLAPAPATWPAAQQDSTAKPASQVVRVTTRLVLVDVVVTDNHGKPVNGLTREDFTILERGKPQAISIFSYEQPASAALNASAPPPLPLHVYTNRPEYRRSSGPPTFLLLDGLNTAPGDQVASREQLLGYVATQIKPDQPVAVLALTGRLTVLQDFTSDPALLRAALGKFTAKKSNQMARGEPRTLTPIEAQSMAMVPHLLETIDRFNQSNYVDSVKDRVRITLAAMRTIARMAAGFPGRKNLLWVSAGFPLGFLPGPDATSGPPANFSDDVRKATSLLSDAQVAVYPVDARGLVGQEDTRGITNQLVDTVQEPVAADGGQIPASHRIENVYASNVTMEQVAADTGGLAITNHNDLSRAVAMTLADSASYYSLGYYPADAALDGKFRKIEVKVVRRGVKLRYRRGYFAAEPGKSPAEGSAAEASKQLNEEILTALADPLPDTAVAFRAYLAPPKPAARAQVQIQFLVDAPAISFQPTPDGGQQCSLEFVVAALTPDGKAVALLGQTAGVHLKPEQFDRVRREGLPFRMQVELEPGNYQLRLAVRDNQSGWIGTLNVPLALPKP